MMTRILATTFAFGVFGCAGGVYEARVGTPDLVYIDPGIQVVVDSDIPIFYTDSYYWRYDGNIWYRSSYATGGWNRYDAIPQHLRRIDNPRQYARYHPRDRQPVVRDHRAPAPTPVVRAQRRPQVPSERDHRERPAQDKGKRNDRDKDHDKKDPKHG